MQNHIDSRVYNETYINQVDGKTYDFTCKPCIGGDWVITCTQIPSLSLITHYPSRISEQVMKYINKSMGA